MFLKDSTKPRGQRTSTRSACLAWPRPKCRRKSFWDMKLEPLITSFIWECLAVTTRTREPIALRLDFVPMHLILSQLFLERESLRRREGGSFMLMMATSRSPSLSKSPKAVPLLLWGWVTADLLAELTSMKRPWPRFLYRI